MQLLNSQICHDADFVIVDDPGVFCDDNIWCHQLQLSWYHDDSFQWHHNERGDVSNRRRLGCLLNRVFRRRSKKTSKLRVNSLCVTGVFPWIKATNEEKVLIWWRHHVLVTRVYSIYIFVRNFGLAWHFENWQKSHDDCNACFSFDLHILASVSKDENYCLIQIIQRTRYKTWKFLYIS